MKNNSNKYDSSQTHLFTSFPNSQADTDEMTDVKLIIFLSCIALRYLIFVALAYDRPG